jgi:ClpA/ClpB-like protein
MAWRRPVPSRQRLLTSVCRLLIGIIDQGHNGALDLLAAAGADAATLRADVLRRLPAAA